MKPLARMMQRAGGSWDLNPGHAESQGLSSEVPLIRDPAGAARPHSHI